MTTLRDLDQAENVDAPPKKESPVLTPDQIRDAAYTMVAVAAVAYEQERLALSRTFARMLTAARDHGLTLDELVEASGRDRALVEQLLEEAG